MVCFRLVLYIFAFLALLDGLLVVDGACGVAEFQCDDGGCVLDSHFCDRIVHCKDYSDEPPGCTVCNRTYYGLNGKTYIMKSPVLTFEAKKHNRRSSRLQFPGTFADDRSILEDWRERSERLAFVCPLTFKALGKNYGDIIQLTFSEFHVGHFNVSGAHDGGIHGCSHDYITIEEPGHVNKGGRWCGESVGLNVYYSETDTVAITVKATSAIYAEYFDNPLRFELRYRFVKKQQAVVRYGSHLFPKYRGEPVRNTPCSRIFQGCRARNCKLQSPNFPGFYPRNLTCYYLVKTLEPPSALLSAVIVLSQSNDRMMQIGQREHASRVSPESILKIDNECTNPDDYVLVYDGGAMRSPLLAKFCGTAKLTNITSSGPEMLIVFHSASSGRMNNLPNLVNGFEFDTHVFFMKKNVHSTHSSVCEEVIHSFGGTSGIIHSPIYAMSENSSCQYSFFGRRDEIVWLYLTKYHRKTGKKIIISESQCRNGLFVSEGISTNGTFFNESRLLGKFCEEEIPPMCVRSREKGFSTRPCSPKESFLSKLSRVSVRQEFNDSTSLKELSYIIHYEFVKVEDTESFKYPKYCDMEFDSKILRKGHFTSPLNVFYYGRGGRRTLNCKYKFISEENEIIKIKLLHVRFPDRFCKTILNEETKTYECLARIPGSAILEINEFFWNKTQINLGCICDNRLGQTSFHSYSNLLEINYLIKDMNWSQDYTDFFFEADFEFLRNKECRTVRIFNGTHGSIALGNSFDSYWCGILPYKILANYNYHVYLNIPGYHSNSQRCQTDSRIVIYDNEVGRPIQSICPVVDSIDYVDVFSSGWRSHLEWLSDSSEQVVFKFLSQDNNNYYLKYLEVFREPHPSALESVKSGSSNDNSFSSCKHECPEISACINPLLWCDGVPHCPSGFDEAQSTCMYQLVPWTYVVSITFSGIALLIFIIISFVGIKMCHRGKKKRQKRKEAQRLMTQEILLPMTYHKDNFEHLYFRGGI